MTLKLCELWDPGVREGTSFWQGLRYASCTYYFITLCVIYFCPQFEKWMNFYLPQSHRHTQRKTVIELRGLWWKTCLLPTLLPLVPYLRLLFQLCGQVIFVSVFNCHPRISSYCSFRERGRETERNIDVREKHWSACAPPGDQTHNLWYTGWCTNLLAASQGDSFFFWHYHPSITISWFINFRPYLLIFSLLILNCFLFF